MSTSINQYLSFCKMLVVLFYVLLPKHIHILKYFTSNTHIILFTVKPFIIGDDLQNMVIKKGQVIKYDIKYGGEPEPEVVWQLNGVEIKDDNDK